MIDIDALSDAEFDALPLVIEGGSKIVRDAGGGQAVIRFKPTIYSFTANRTEEVRGSDVLRLRTTKVFVEVLHTMGVRHAYRKINDRFVLSDLVASPPPVEVVVKAFHSGASKLRYFGMAGSHVRASHRSFANYTFGAEGGYPTPIVRFDWRNPVWHPATGEMLAGELLCDAQADWYIDVEKARATALQTYKVLSSFLGDRDVVVYDICLFVTEDGGTVFGEISQARGRFRHFELGSLDKDVWRSGASPEHVLERWRALLDIIER